ncbi:MAG: 30S ribosomal protein S15 [Pseudomonadota bacterium]|nr:30S ribosomal protein S15 [Gammaproteobacteria bacterium]MBU1559027.1 30S ribosomal protein S15 [Gammaproteobacteria bacterium]MBU1629307.1 30S ribosomal protein S15 [Gammaproteobacteria bacterium]MBU2546047.1 30S ribosomal protein S15 [Gammaproteobacteria bacterium]
MRASVKERQKIIAEYQKSEGDTGSVEVQVALLTNEISGLTAHMQSNKKDFHSLRGLMAKVNRSRRLLKYLKRTDRDRYETLIERLNLKDV